MIQYNKLNVKLFTSQLNKLKSAIKMELKKLLNLPSNLFGILMMELIFHINNF